METDLGMDSFAGIAPWDEPVPLVLPEAPADKFLLLQQNIQRLEEKHISLLQHMQKLQENQIVLQHQVFSMCQSLSQHVQEISKYKRARIEPPPEPLVSPVSVSVVTEDIYFKSELLQLFGHLLLCGCFLRTDVHLSPIWVLPRQAPEDYMVVLLYKPLVTLIGHLNKKFGLRLPSKFQPGALQKALELLPLHTCRCKVDVLTEWKNVSTWLLTPPKMLEGLTAPCWEQLLMCAEKNALQMEERYHLPSNFLSQIDSLFLEHQIEEAERASAKKKRFCEGKAPNLNLPGYTLGIPMSRQDWHGMDEWTGIQTTLFGGLPRMFASAGFQRVFAFAPQPFQIRMPMYPGWCQMTSTTTTPSQKTGWAQIHWERQRIYQQERKKPFLQEFRLWQDLFAELFQVSVETIAQHQNLMIARANHMSLWLSGFFKPCDFSQILEMVQKLVTEAAVVKKTKSKKKEVVNETPVEPPNNV